MSVHNLICTKEDRSNGVISIFFDKHLNIDEDVNGKCNDNKDGIRHNLTLMIIAYYL